MKAIIHIGTEKTGTTSIQEYLYLNRKLLKSAGYHFLQSAGKTNNRAIPAYCIDDERPDDFFREEGIQTPEEKYDFRKSFLNKFENEIGSIPKSIHTVVMSSEHFHSRIRSEAEMDNLYTFLSAYFDEIKIICYLREQVSMCTSLYSTHIKNSGTQTLTEILQLCQPESSYFNYADMLENWERCFGFQSLDVSLFSRERFLNADLLDDFTAKLDTALVGKLSKLIEPQNESFRPLGQALARAVNISFPVKSERPEINDLRHRCMKIVVEDLAGSGQQPSSRARKVIYDSFIESNERVRQKFFPEIEILFPPPVEATEPDIIIADVDYQGIADVFNVLRKYGKGAMLPEEYAHVCRTIFMCIDDIARVEIDAIEVDAEVDTGIDAEVIVSGDDALLFVCAAGSIQGRDPDSAYKLVALAEKVLPDSPIIKAKLEEYRQQSELAPKFQYIVTYHDSAASLSREEVKRLVFEFQVWLGSLDVPEGSPLIRLTQSNIIRSDGTVADAGQSTRVGFSIFKAESLDDALAIVKRCPYLELGGTLEVSEVGELQVQST